jgi:membrane protease YdiL (CAAX protease family)
MFHRSMQLNRGVLMPSVRAAAALLAVLLVYAAPPHALLRIAHRMPAGIDPFFLLFIMQAVVFTVIAALLKAPVLTLARSGVCASGFRAVLWLWAGAALLALLASLSAVSTSSSRLSVADGLAALAIGSPNFGIPGAILQRVFFMPLLEEFLFRVLILGFLLASMRPWLALAISVALFAIGHSSWLVSGFMGVALGLLYLRYRSVWLCIVAHGGHNLMVLGLPLLVAFLHERNVVVPIQHNLLALQIAWVMLVVACFWMFFHHVLVVAGRGGPSLFASQCS